MSAYHYKLYAILGIVCNPLLLGLLATYVSSLASCKKSRMIEWVYDICFLINAPCFFLCYFLYSLSFYEEI